jgi:hypothetical protein
LIQQGTPALAVPSGWPNYALTERTGSLSAVRNAVINFLAGTEYFTFFGWNPEWPATNWWTKGDDQCFAVISCTKDGRRTPSLYTLAIGVLTAQMEGALPATGVTVNEGGIAGGRFAKQDGGQVAVLWSSLGKRGVVVETADPAPELVSLFGESSRLSASRSRGRYCYRVELTEQPVYIQVKSADLRLLPSPVVNVRPTGREGNVYRVAFALVNRYGKPWAGRVELAAPAGWQIEPATPGFDLASGARREVELQCTVPPLTPRGDHPVEASLTLPDGNRFTFPIEVSVRPSFTAARLPPDVKLTDLGAWEMPGGALQLDRPEQVTMGRPPLLAALQEQKYWQGPAELSGRVKVGYNADGLLVYIRAHDANLRLPATWPGVGGSCVELFFDFRPATDGLGRGAYEQGVYQVILKPSLAADQPVEIWNASQQYGILKDLTVAGGRIDAANYWVALRIPWANISGGMHPGYAFNFDVGLDGSLPNTPGRKSQIMLFGNANNCLNASDFGSGTLAPPAPNRP